MTNQLKKVRDHVKMLTMEKTLVFILVTTLGALLGSFTTMLVTRLHFDQKGIFTGRSECPSCGAQLKFWNLVPIFSWLIQRGMCQACGKKISLFYPLTELVFAITFFLFAFHFYETWHLFPILLIVFFTLVLFIYDVRFFEVDDRVAIPAIIFAAIYAFFRELPWIEYLIGGGLGFLFYAFQYYVSRGKWVGAGDMRLGLFMGLVLGWKFLFPALFLAYMMGTLFVIPLLVMKKVNRKTAMPMGAFLMPALLVFLFMGDTILNWYLHFTF